MYERRRVWGLLIVFALLAGAGFGIEHWVENRHTPGVWRIGYENNPPNMVVEPDGTLTGLAIDVVREAAARAGLRLQWVRYEGGGSALLEGGADLWPLMANLPERQRNLHLTEPWLQTHYMLLYRAGQEKPSTHFQGRIGHYGQPLHARLVAGSYPQAVAVPYPSREALIQGLCDRQVEAGWLEERGASRLAGAGGAAPCALQSEAVNHSLVQFSLASTKNAAAAADRIRREIGEMARDGSLALDLARYVNTGIHDATAAYELEQARQRSRFLEILAGCLAVLLATILWQNRQMHAARRLAERSGAMLKASEARLRTLLEHAADVIVTIDGCGRLDYVSPSCPHVLGWASQDLVGKSLQELIDPKERERFQAAIDSLPPSTELPSKIAFRLLHQDHSYHSFQAMVRRLPGGDGGVLINARDVTSETRLQEQLQQSQKMEALGRLAAGIAHDFNNLLTVINGYSSMLVRRVQPSDPSARRLQEIYKAGQKAVGLTQQLLAFSRKQVIAPRPVNLNAVVEEMLEMLRPVMGEDISIAAIPGSGLGTVSVDPGQMHQVIMNLAANARDAMPDGGKLLIETRNVELAAGQHPEMTPGAYVLLAVSDTGTGMDAATMRSIFEPFFTTKEKGKGTGLGLATVHGIVRQNGGWIWVYSEPGQGSTFKIYFPSQGVALESAAPEKAAPGPRQAGGQTILVVEDQASVRLLMRDVLRAEGYRLLEAVNGEDAMRVASGANGIDLLLTDMVLPDMNGTQVAERIESVQPWIKVLYTSGYTENALVRRCALRPGFQYLEKPFSPESLALKVRDILG